MAKDTGLKFGKDKCGILAMKLGNEVECNGIELENGEEIGQIEEEGYKSTLAKRQRGYTSGWDKRKH